MASFVKRTGSRRRKMTGVQSWTVRELRSIPLDEMKRIAETETETDADRLAKAVAGSLAYMRVLDTLRLKAKAEYRRLPVAWTAASHASLVQEFLDGNLVYDRLSEAIVRDIDSGHMPSNVDRLYREAYLFRKYPNGLHREDFMSKSDVAEQVQNAREHERERRYMDAQDAKEHRRVVAEYTHEAKPDAAIYFPRLGQRD